MTEQEAAALMAQASGIDTANLEVTAQEGALPAAAVDPDAGAKEWILIPETVAWAIVAVYPETAPNYTDAIKMDLARKISDVAQKYGLNGPGGSPEMLLAFSALAFAMPAVMAHKARKAKPAEADEGQGGGGG